MAAEPSHPAGADGPDTMKLLCSHGERLTPPGRSGGETRVLVVPRDVSFRELTRRLQEMTGGGAAVLAVRHCLVDYYEGLEDDDVLVSVTCDEELAHMRAEYDRLLATRTAARFRVFVTTEAASTGSGKGVVHRGRSPAAGLPPLAPKKTRCVQSEQVLQVHHRAAYPAAAVRRVQSAQEFTGPSGSIHAQRSFQHHQCCCCCCQRRDLCAPAPPPASPMNAVPYMSKIISC